MKHRRPAKGVHRKPESIYSKEEADARLYDLFRHHEFGDFPHAERHQLVQFYLLLMNHQLSENVTRLVKFRDIGIKHFIDSLMVPRLTSLMFPLMDVGTGAGFPGIPLKIIYPTEKILLAEGVLKRVDFLKAVRDEMGLKELQVIGRKIDGSFQLPVRGVITRALQGDICHTLHSVSQSLEVGGKAFLMKGPNVDEDLKKAIREWGEYFELTEDHDYKLPNTPHERRLLVFTKVKTPPFTGTLDE